MKIEDFIQGMQKSVKQLREAFFNEFGTNPEDFDNPFAAPEIVKKVECFINFFEKMNVHIETAEKIQNGMEVSDDEITALLEIEAGKDCEEIIEIAKERNILNNDISFRM